MRVFWSPFARGLGIKVRSPTTRLSRPLLNQTRFTSSGLIYNSSHPSRNSTIAMETRPDRRTRREIP
ncbi:hypothetical protein RSAG8_08523, partial [Rhizoctonia solani AG-8 WAC10335]